MRVKLSEFSTAPLAILQRCYSDLSCKNHTEVLLYNDGLSVTHAKYTVRWGGEAIASLNKEKNAIRMLKN